MSRRSAPPSSACAPPASTPAPASAAPASISAASRRRRSYNPLRNSPRRATAWPSTASGSAWLRLGANVTIVEYLDRILPNMDRELGPALQRVLARSGIAFKLATKVVGGSLGNAGVTLELERTAGGERESLAADVVLVAI